MVTTRFLTLVTDWVTVVLEVLTIEAALKTLREGVPEYLSWLMV